MKIEWIREGELKMLKMIAESKFRDSEDLTISVFSPAVTLEEKGWLSSCVKKGFACMDSHIEGYETTWLTKKGIDFIKREWSV